MDKKKSCFTQYLIVRDVFSGIADGRYCGNTLPPDLVSTGALKTEKTLIQVVSICILWQVILFASVWNRTWFVLNLCFIRDSEQSIALQGWLHPFDVCLLNHKNFLSP